MYLKCERGITVDRSRLDDTQCSLCIGQYDHSIILNLTTCNVAITGTDAFWHTQEEARQVHGMAAEVNHSTTRRLCRIEEMGRKPAMRTLGCGNGTVMREPRPDHCEHTQLLPL